MQVWYCYTSQRPQQTVHLYILTMAHNSASPGRVAAAETSKRRSRTGKLIHQHIVRYCEVGVYQLR